MNRRELEQCIKDEVAEWPGVEVEFGNGGSHPKAKFTYTSPDGGKPMILSRAFGGNQAHVAFPHKMLADMRKVMVQLGATRQAPEPTKEETEKRYHKPNPGADLRPDPVQGEPATAKPDMADQLVAAGAASPEQAAAARAKPDVIVVPDEGETEEEAEADAEAARLQAAVDAIVDGVYFDLPEEIYHAVPRLSASGMQKLCISPATFWRNSWLDPNPVVLTEEQAKVKESAKRIGKAYHTARLQPHLFEAQFIREPDKADYPAKGLLTSDAAVKAELKARGLTQSIGTESIEERAQRLLDNGYEGTIWPLVKAEWDRTVGRRIPLSAKVWDEIATDMERLRTNGELADLLSGGEAEVSIFWTDEHGLKMKARLDYLKLESWADLKSFANPNGKELERALADAVQFNRYHIQAVNYRDAVEAIRLGGLQVRGEATDAQRKLVAGIQMRPGELACWYIFQEKAGIPNVLAYEFDFFEVPMNTKLGHAGASEEAIARVEEGARTRTQLHVRARMDIEKAKRAFVLHCQVYEPGQPWQPIEQRRSFGSLSFNQYWLEGKL
jgi:hypothetical protein